jgi:hypothetical protein
MGMFKELFKQNKGFMILWIVGLISGVGIIGFLFYALILVIRFLSNLV